MVFYHSAHNMVQEDIKMLNAI